MTIDLKSIIEEDSAIKNGGYTGAVFLTYTLNLGFFEQIVVPALERAGCSNVLIIADPDGYADALDRGIRNVANAGLRYVCSPIPRKGYGVQHVKMLLMAGPDCGRLLIGSGNLTLHGYSKNLEVYCHYEYDRKNPDSESQLAFHEAWGFLRNMAQKETFSSPVIRQLNVISENAGWLNNEPEDLQDFRIWNNYEISLWSQLLDWRNKHGLTGTALKGLQVFSPYFDPECEMLRKFQENLLPGHIDLFVSRENTTLDGQQLIQTWPKSFPIPNTYEIKEMHENQSQRLLHAKIVVGIEDNGAWCISGSANMTRAAFANTWQTRSNLEMVNFRWSPDPTAFNYLLKKPVSTKPIKLNTLHSSKFIDLSEEPQRVFSDTILLTELTIHNGVLSGQLNFWPELSTGKDTLFFLRSGKSVSIEINQDFRFLLPYTGEIRSCEAALVKGINCASLPRWIDVPEILQDYGSRSYHERIQAKLDTVRGAESLFHELMEFLLDRAVPDQSGGSGRLRPRHRIVTKTDAPEEDIQTPEADQFIVPERAATGEFLLGRHTRIPYDRNIHSLRDLLSIVLLKLTQPTTVSTEKNIESDDTSPEDIDLPDDGEEEIQIIARQRLCKYIINYSWRYAQRICQENFIEGISPGVLLDNQVTLSRILIEFENRIEEFTSEDFTYCYWLTWASLIWPSIIGIEGKSTIQFFSEKDLDCEFRNAWNQINIPSLFVIMTSIAFLNPPSWSVGLHNPGLTSKFLIVQELISRFEQFLGSNIWTESPIENIGIGKAKWEECVSTFQRIRTYQSPALERLAPIFEWVELNTSQNPQIESVVEKIHKEGLQNELEAYQRQPKQIYGVFTEPDDENEGDVYCPRCGGALPATAISEINRGKLVLCKSSSDVWLYKTEQLPKKIL